MFVATSRPSRHVADVRLRSFADVGTDSEDARRGIRHRGVHIDHERQGFVIDLDQLEGVGGDVGTERGDGGDFLSGEADFTIVKRKHGAHAGKMLRGGQIDVANPRVRPGAAQDRAVEHAGQFDIVGVVRGTGRLQGSIDARGGLANDGQAVAPIPRSRLVVGDDDGYVLSVALEAEVEGDASRHQTSFVAAVARADLAVSGRAALSAAAKTCG